MGKVINYHDALHELSCTKPIDAETRYELYDFIRAKMIDEQTREKLTNLRVDMEAQMPAPNFVTDEIEPSALYKQEGGSHYRDMAIQPAEFIHANRDRIGWHEGTAIEYLCRWRFKGGIADLEKAIHTIQLLIQLETEDEKLREAAGMDRTFVRPDGERDGLERARAGHAGFGYRYYDERGNLKL